MSAPNNAALAAARETGYRQMADHDKAGLIERLQWACDSDHELAAALRGAAAALQDAAGVVEAMAAREPVGYVVSDAGSGDRTYWCLACAPESVRVEANEVYPGSQAAEDGDCEGCGRWLADEEQQPPASGQARVVGPSPLEASEPLAVLVHTAEMGEAYDRAHLDVADIGGGEDYDAANPEHRERPYRFRVRAIAEELDAELGPLEHASLYLDAAGARQLAAILCLRVDTAGGHR